MENISDINAARLFSVHSLDHAHNLSSTVESDMSIVTLATNLSKAIDPSGNVYTYWPTAGGSRLAVPLTTAWSFPATCTGTDSVLAISSCSPPSFKGVYDFHGYYSPGVCYEGYEIGCVATVANVNYETVKPGETVAFCVPK
jgi:hypothetical protein